MMSDEGLIQDQREKLQVINFFKDVKQPTFVNLSKVVTYIRKVDPNYLKGNGQGQDLMSTAENLPAAIKKTLTKITKFVKE